MGFINPASLETPNLIEVVGSESGSVSGELIISTDGKTMIFKPFQKFFPNETGDFLTQVHFQSLAVNAIHRHIMTIHALVRKTEQQRSNKAKSAAFLLRMLRSKAKKISSLFLIRNSVTIQRLVQILDKMLNRFFTNQRKSFSIVIHAP